MIRLNLCSCWQQTTYRKVTSVFTWFQRPDAVLFNAGCNEQVLSSNPVKKIRCRSVSSFSRIIISKLIAIIIEFDLFRISTYLIASKSSLNLVRNFNFKIIWTERSSCSYWEVKFLVSYHRTATTVENIPWWGKDIFRGVKHTFGGWQNILNIKKQITIQKTLGSWARLFLSLFVGLVGSYD